MERDFKGVWIPKEIWLCKDLTALDRVIYAEISSLDNENHCTASNKYFAEFCGVGEATVTRSIQKLIEKGYIENVSFDGRHRVIKVSGQPNQNDEAASSKRLANNIDNNTNSNIDNNISKDILEENLDDTASKLYDSSDFLGKYPKKSKPKKKSLYDKCVDEIDQFTHSLKLRTILIDYLNFRLEVKDKPIYFNQWKGMLKKLKTLGTDDTYIDIVQQSLDKGWLSFYELKTFNSSADKFAEFGDVITEHKEEEYVDRVF